MEGSSRTNSIYKQDLESTHYVPSSSSEPSALFTQLKTLSAKKEEAYDSVTRTEGFSETPLPPPGKPTGTIRDENLAIIEELEPGPIEHRPITDDPNFEKLEPNSGIRLKCVIMPQSFAQC